MTRALLTTLALVSLLTPSARAQSANLDQVKITQRIGATAPLGLTFRDTGGRSVSLGDCLGHKPTLMLLGYYRCPMLCNLMLDDLPRTLKGVPLRIGKDYQFVMVSIAPAETPALAAERRDGFIAGLKRAPGSPESDDAEAGQGVRMLTGDAGSIRQLADAVGYGFAYDARSGQYAHPAALIVLAPDGTISRYLFGIKFASLDLRLALVEAGKGQIGSAADGVLLHCYQFDPATGTYGLAVMTALRVGGGLTVVMLAGLVTLLTLHQRKTERLRVAGTGERP